MRISVANGGYCFMPNLGYLVLLAWLLSERGVNKMGGAFCGAYELQRWLFETSKTRARFLESRVHLDSDQN